MNVSARQLSVALAASFVALSAFAAAAGAAPFFQGVGDLTGGAVRSQAIAISADGATVVGDSDSANGPEAFRWTLPGGIVGLGDLAGSTFRSFAYDVSADGSVVVGFSLSAASSIFPEAFRWTQATNMVGLGDVPGGLFESDAHAVSADGTIVAGLVYTLPGYEAMKWTLTNPVTSAGTMTALGDLPGGDVAATVWGMSGDGTVFVGRGSVDPEAVTMTPQTEAFMWTASGGFVSLGDLTGGIIGSSARAVSLTGGTVVGYATSGAGANAREAFRWTQATGMVGLGDLALGNRFSEANAVSADGTVVVGYGTTGSGNEAFIWTPGAGLKNLKQVLQTGSGLNLTGWTLTSANDITPDGLTIVGAGINPQGVQEGWIARMRTPCPADLDGDGMVGSADLARLLGFWGATGAGIQGDLNGDGAVNSGDLALLLGAWGPCP